MPVTGTGHLATEVYASNRLVRCLTDGTITGMSTAFLGDLTLFVFTLGCGVCGCLAWRWLRLLRRRYADAPTIPFRLAFLPVVVTFLFMLFGGCICVSCTLLCPGCTSLLGVRSVQDSFRMVSDRMNLAINRGDVAAVKSMLAHGADPNGLCWDPVEDSQQERPYPLLQEAALFRRPTSMAMLQLLLDHGAKIDADDGAGCTALWLAVASKSVAGTRLLLRRGANPNVSLKYGGESALAEARRSKNQVLVRLLKRYGAHD